ncbi:MAG: ABC transporter permease [Oscillospiraceae bacterium]
MFLFAPIVILLVFSFNEAKSLSVFSGFSFKWYQELFRDAETLNALRNTLILAVVASLVSTVMGTAAAVGMNKLRNKYLRAALDTATDIPMMNPDIITGISLMLMFVFFGRLLGASTSLGFWSMLAAHITFCLPYVIMQVLPKLQQMDRALPEAAMDLGCTPVRAFFRVEVPEILPGIITGMIMAFTLSLDDFVISYFTQGSGFQTLPIRIYNMTKKTVTPKMYALATIIFFVILALLLLTNLVDEDDTQRIRDARRAKREGKPARAARSNGRRPCAPPWASSPPPRCSLPASASTAAGRRRAYSMSTTGANTSPTARTIRSTPSPRSRTGTRQPTACPSRSTTTPTPATRICTPSSRAVP